MLNLFSQFVPQNSFKHYLCTVKLTFENATQGIQCDVNFVYIQHSSFCFNFFQDSGVKLISKSLTHIEITGVFTLFVKQHSLFWFLFESAW